MKKSEDPKGFFTFRVNAAGRSPYGQVALKHVKIQLYGKAIIDKLVGKNV